MTSKRGLLRAAVGVLLCAALAACGSSASSVSGGAPAAGQNGASGSFVGTGSNAAVLVQRTRSGSQLAGSLQQALLQGQAPSETVHSQSVAFTGTVQDQSITLSLQQGLGTVTNLTAACPATSSA